MARMMKRYRPLAYLSWPGVLLVLLLSACGYGSASPSSTQVSASGTQRVTQFSTKAQTSDKLYTITFVVSPDQPGDNTFTVMVNTSSHIPVTDARVSLETTMVDMYMGTDTVTLQSDGQGHYSGKGTLDMNGRWSVRVVIHTSDGKLHTATVLFSTTS